MASNPFTTPDGNISFTLPEFWEEYDDGEENTFAFFDSRSWTGNLRITPLYWNRSNSSSKNAAAQFIQDEIVRNEGAIRMKLGYYDCAHYKKYIEQEGDPLVIYYWAVGNSNHLFLCSLTIAKEQETKQMNVEVLATIEDVIESIKINSAIGDI